VCAPRARVSLRNTCNDRCAFTCLHRFVSNKEGFSRRLLVDLEFLEQSPKTSFTLSLLRTRFLQSSDNRIRMKLGRERESKLIRPEATSSYSWSQLFAGLLETDDRRCEINRQINFKFTARLTARQACELSMKPRPLSLALERNEAPQAREE